jgi:hypothetical protein
VQRVLDLQAFGFGDRVENADTGKAVPEYSLHVQSRWRIVRDGVILVGAGDIFWPPDGSDVGYQDFDYDGRPSRRDDLLDDFVAHGEPSHTVEDVEGASTGDARITLRDGCVLELWRDHQSGSDADGPDELWRFFRAAADAQFVVTTNGIET